MSRFQNCSFPFYLFSLHGGICGRGALSIIAPCTYFLCAAIYPVYIYSLTCLSPLSTVEKEPQTLGQTQKWTNSQTRPKNITHMHTHCSFLQYNLAVQLSVWEKRREAHYQTEHSWQRAVCPSADRSISSVWWTDRWRLCKVMSREKKLLPHQRRNLQFEMRGLHAQVGTHAITHRIAICSHFSGLVLN